MALRPDPCPPALRPLRDVLVEAAAEKLLREAAHAEPIATPEVPKFPSTIGADGKIRALPEYRFQARDGRWVRSLNEAGFPPLDPEEVRTGARGRPKFGQLNMRSKARLRQTRMARLVRELILWKGLAPDRAFELVGAHVGASKATVRRAFREIDGFAALARNPERYRRTIELARLRDLLKTPDG